MKKVGIFLLVFFSINNLFAQKDEDFLAKDNQYAGFIKNKGQIVNQLGTKRQDVLYSYQSKGFQVFITEKGLSYQFSRTQNLTPTDEVNTISESIEHTINRIDVEFTQKPNLSNSFALEPTGYKENYYLAQCMSGITGNKAYSKITFKNIYPNIDWVIYTDNGFIKYDFEVRKGADVSVLQLQYKGAKSISLDNENNLILKTELGTVKELSPTYISADNNTINGTYSLNKQILSFENIPENFVGTIDPKIIWSTLYGDKEREAFSDIAIDSNDNVIAFGGTASSKNIATTGAYQSVFHGNFDVFVVKFLPNGIRLWGTYYGASDLDACNAGTLGDFENIYITGITKSDTSLWATPGAFQTNYNGGGDAYLVKLDSTGKRIWATYIGSANTGILSDWGYDVVYNPRNNEVYVSGHFEDSAGITTAGVHQTTYGGKSDAFITSFDTTGKLLWGTFFGGEGSEMYVKIALGKKDELYAYGTTESVNNIATTGAFQPKPNFYSFQQYRIPDNFIAKFDVTGKLKWSTYYGDLERESFGGIMVGNDSNVYISGTSSMPIKTSLGTPGTYMPKPRVNGVRDGFVVKFTPNGERVWCTYLDLYRGGTSDIYVDEDLDLFISANTLTPNRATNNAFQTQKGTDYDGMIFRLDSSGNMKFASYYGATGSDDLSKITKDSKGFLYVAGQFSSADNNTIINGHQLVAGGNRDGILAKFDTCLGFMYIKPPEQACKFEKVALKATGATNYIWETNETTDSIVVSIPATKVFWVKGTDKKGCFDSTWTTVHIVPDPIASIKGNNNVCKDDTITLRAESNQAGTQLWSTGDKTKEIDVSPDSATIYWCVVTNYAGCTADTLTRIVNILDENFDIKILGPNSVCIDDSITLEASAGINHQWLSGGTGKTKVVSPKVPTVYTVTGQNNFGCKDTASFLVNINYPTNNVSIAISKDTACIGDSVFLSTIGSLTRLEWDTKDTTSSIVLLADSSRNITLNYIDILGCKNSTSTQIIVGTIPTVEITGTDSICEGDTVWLEAQGASSFEWNTNDTSKNIVVTPTQTKTYTVQGTTPLGCSNTAAYNVYVNRKPFFYITGVENVFEEDTVHYEAQTVSGYYYSWNVSNGTIINSPGFNKINIRWDKKDSGWVSLQLEDSIGFQCKTNDTLYTIIYKQPTNPNTSVSEINNSSFKVYPNPFSNTITIENFTGKPLNYKVFTIEGKNIIEGTFIQKHQIKTDFLPSAVYILAIEGKKIRLIKH